MIDPAKSNQDLDLSYLVEMSGNSPDFMIEMLDTLVAQIPLYLADVQNAAAAEDWKATSGFAHKLKPTFYYVGREDVRDYVQVIETNAKELKNLDNITKALNEIKVELDRILVQVAKAKAELEKKL